MFPRLPTRSTFVADTNFVSDTQKMFLILFRNILCLQQMFPSLRSPRHIMGNNVSATMCPRLPGPLADFHVGRLCWQSWKLEMLVLVEGGKLENPESNPGHIGGRGSLTPLRHPCSSHQTTSCHYEKLKSKSFQ